MSEYLLATYSTDCNYMEFYVDYVYRDSNLKQVELRYNECSVVDDCKMLIKKSSENFGKDPLTVINDIKKCGNVEAIASLPNWQNSKCIVLGHMPVSELQLYGNKYLDQKDDNVANRIFIEIDSLNRITTFASNTRLIYRKTGDALCDTISVLDNGSLVVSYALYRINDSIVKRLQLTTDDASSIAEEIFYCLSNDFEENIMPIQIGKQQRRRVPVLPISQLYADFVQYDLPNSVCGKQYFHYR
jgi:hypothetical protein